MHKNIPTNISIQYADAVKEKKKSISTDLVKQINYKVLETTYTLSVWQCNTEFWQAVSSHYSEDAESNNKQGLWSALKAQAMSQTLCLCGNNSHFLHSKAES